MGTVVLVMVIFALLYVLAKTVAVKTWRRFHDRRDDEEVIVIRAGRDEGPDGLVFFKLLGPRAGAVDVVEYPAQLGRREAGR